MKIANYSWFLSEIISFQFKLTFHHIYAFEFMHYVLMKGLLADSLQYFVLKYSNKYSYCKIIWFYMGLLPVPPLPCSNIYTKNRIPVPVGKYVYWRNHNIPRKGKHKRAKYNKVSVCRKSSSSLCNDDENTIQEFHFNRDNTTIHINVIAIAQDKLWQI